MNGKPAAPREVVGPGLRRLLVAVLVLFALLVLNSVYLGAVTLAEWRGGTILQDRFYLLNFLLHLVLGIALAPMALAFAGAHLRRAWTRPNRRAVRAGLGLLTAAVVLIASGFALLGYDVVLARRPALRGIAYWLHVAAPLAVAWLFVLHRLAGPPIRWRAGAAIALASVAIGAVMVLTHAPTKTEGPAIIADEHRPFYPALAQTAGGGFIPARLLQMDDYCAQCHADIHARWQWSAHRFSSFNNPAYRFSVRRTREMLLARDGHVRASRFCAGCHDPVPLFAGLFDDPHFGEQHPTATAGITCTSCHAITRIDSPRGNADFTIEASAHYPFTFSERPLLAWINRRLIEAKPAFHRATFLKPLHRTPEFCGACHKVHLPVALNGYKWLRGQNHYDSFLLSGVSGHGAQSFYYPERAKRNCTECHMPLTPSGDFGARPDPSDGALKVHDHLFPAANTAIPALVGLPPAAIEAHRRFLEGSLRLDLFALLDGDASDAPVLGPLRPQLPVLQPGRTYVVELVLRTLGVGHDFTQGTADSNEVWVELIARMGDRKIGASGLRDAASGAVDPWAHFVNAYVLDREGNRIDRRNPEDIFVALYDHQIPPGAADVVHYRLAIPPQAHGTLTLEARLLYRKFDTAYLRHFSDDRRAVNDLPVVTLAEDRVTLPVGAAQDVGAGAPPGPAWERWNDYGIGLLRKPELRQLRQAAAAFARVEALGRAEGAVNLARVYLAEGRLDEAAAALERAQGRPHPWTAAWLAAAVDRQRGYLEQAEAHLRDVLDTRFPEARARGFDFGRDYRVLNALGETLFERARRMRGDGRTAERSALLEQAASTFERTLRLDPENVAAHHNLALLYTELGDTARADRHRRLHATYRPDENARDRVIAIHRRRSPAADHAADPVVVYDLHRSAVEPGG